MQNRKPMVLVFAGPNGSGKSQEHWVKWEHPKVCVNLQTDVR